jgi:hypothetical protein
MSKPPSNGPENGKSGKKKGKRTAHLIAVHQKREAVRVYAVLAISAETALTQVRAMATDVMEVEIVGALSRDMARQLGLKVGELRLV